MNTENISTAKYELYNAQIEKFFLENYITKKTYTKGEHIDDTRHNTVTYIHKGLVKLYSLNADGNEMFTGFVPQYSTLIPTLGLESLNKFPVANGDVEVLFVALNDYLLFLQSNPDLILHQLREPYYRRNFNDLPHYETVSQPSRLKVYVYLRYLAYRFGKASTTAENVLIVNNAPTMKDIAHYNDIHPNNVTTFFNELKHKGILSRNKDKIIIYNLEKLDEEIANLKS